MPRKPHLPPEVEIGKPEPVVQPMSGGSGPPPPPPPPPPSDPGPIGP